MVHHKMLSGQPLKKSRKVESGAQLLARLNSHKDLSCLDPDIFDKSSQGQIIEVYGTEGTGKTEMLLHYISKACLPSNWNGHSLNGFGSKVIFIDTEFKFSVFRLAIVMEKQILSLRERMKQKCNENESVTQNNVNCSSFDVPVQNEVISALDKCDVTEDKSCSHAELTRLCQTNLNDDSMNSTGCEIMPDISGVRESLSLLSKRMSSSFKPGHYEKKLSDQSPSVAKLELTAQDVEDIVQDALGRVQIMNVLSTDQLLVSLLSLEHSLSCDPLISVIAIDTISAFYWTDKLGDLENHFITDTKMKLITNTISKFVSEFGLTFLVTKSALIGKKRMWTNDREGAKSGCGSNSSDVHNFSDVTDKSGKGLCEHVEFLGKSWSSLKKKRIVLTKSVDGVGREARRAWSTDWAICKLFICADDGFKFV